MTDRGQRLEELFDGALEATPEERESWLRARCPDDAALRDEVLRMLAAHDAAGGPLDTPLPPPQQTLISRLAGLADRYVIDREIGRGGSAVVYLAHELKHGRQVVLKVLKPEAAAAFGPDRFQREVKLAARLTHPHILGLIDSGEVDRLPFYVMPWVGGETLRDKLRTGPLPCAEALVLLRDIADALACAHASGVIHRDLKPENVLCVGGHAFLLDFGIAKLASLGDGEFNTSIGFLVGTPAYMAPEQRKGDTVDRRADIYAWGLLATEMLTGANPARPVAGVMAGTSFGLEPSSTPTMTLLRNDIPPSLPRLIGKCLEEDPADRPRDASGLLAQLEPLLVPGAVTPPAPVSRRQRRWPLVAAGLLFTALVIWGVAFPHRGASHDPLDLPVAVAAFANETADSSLDLWGRMAGDWISQGLQETGLVRVVPWPTVLQASARRPADPTANPVTILRDETGAGTVITGSYYAVGDSIRFQSQVTDAGTGALLAAPLPVMVHRSQLDMGVQLVRDRLMGAMAVWTGDRLRRVPGLAERPPTYQAYLAFNRGLDEHLVQNYREATAEFDQAWRLDTSFVVPLVYSAMSRYNTGDYAELDSVLGEIRLRRASLSEYHDLILQFFEATLADDGERALRLIRQTSAIAPASQATYDLAYTALRVGRWEEALEALGRLSPDKGAMRGWSSYWTQLTHALHLAGDHARERRAARELRSRFPDRRVGLVLEVRAAAAMGDTATVDSLLTDATALPPDTYWSLGAAMVVAGEELIAHGYSAGPAYLDRAVHWLANQLARDPSNRPHRYWIGSALYDGGQWSDAAPYFQSLVTDYPNRVGYNGLAALVSARLGDTAGARRKLGDSPRYQLGDYTVYRARLAAIRGDSATARALFSEALAHGLDGYPWMHAAAWHEWAALQPVGTGPTAPPAP